MRSVGVLAKETVVLMTMLMDDKSWVARQLNLGKRVAWIEQERQIPRDEIITLGEQLGLRLDTDKDTMTGRPAGLDPKDPNAPGYVPPQPPAPVDPHRFAEPRAPFVPPERVPVSEIQTERPENQDSTHAGETDEQPTPDQPVWVCPVCDQEETLGERFHFTHRVPVDPDCVAGKHSTCVGEVGTCACACHFSRVADSAYEPAVEEAIEHVTEQIDDLAGSYRVVADTVEGPPSTTVQVMGSTPTRAAAELIVADGVIVKARGQLTDLARQLAREIGANGMLIDVATARYLDAKAELERVKAVEDGLVADLLAEIRAPEGPPEARATRAQASTAATQSAAYNDRITATGVSAMQIRVWAARNGVPCPKVSRIPGRVLDAFEAANR